MQKKQRLPAEMYDKVNYMCRKYMDRIARFELDYDVIPDIDVFKTVIVEFFKAAPVFHSKFIDNHIAPYWLVSDYSIDDVLTVKETSDLEKSADEFLLQGIDVRSNVQMKIAILTDKGKCKICFRWNHMCMDGGDLKQFLADFFRNYNRYANDRNAAFDFKNGSRSYKEVYRDFSPADRKKAKKLYSAVSAENTHHLPFTKAEKTDRKILVRHKVDKGIFENARLIGKAYGATVNDVIAAAYIRAFYEISGCNTDEKVGMSCAIDLRRYIKNLRNTGYTNHTAFLPCTVNGKGRTITSDLISVRQSTKQVKADKFMGLHGLPLLNLGYSTMIHAQAELLVGAFYKNANLSISNVGKFDVDAFCIGNRKPIGAAVAGAAKEKPCAMMTALTFEGELALSICIRGNDKDAEMLKKFLCLIEKNLKELYDV